MRLTKKLLMNDDLIRRNKLKEEYLKYDFFPAIISRLLKEAPAVDAVPIDEMELYQFSIDTKTHMVKAVFKFGEKKITLCRDCGELAPVVHGRVETTTDRYMVMHQNCSECGEELEWKAYPNYCHNCGAKLDGEIQ